MNIKDKIHEIRGKQVMLDSDLAYLYEVLTKRLNEQVKRNKDRFPENFMFQITVVEYEELNSKIANNTLRFQNGTSSHGGRRYLPYAFTEQGVSMLSAVLRSKKAIDTSIQIINAFVAMRHFLAQNTQLFQRVDRLEKKEIYHIGASLKDLGKKWFAFSKLDKESLKLLENLDKQTVLSKNF